MKGKLVGRPAPRLSLGGKVANNQRAHPHGEDTDQDLHTSMRDAIAGANFR
jgi:hypothetical protein